MKNKIALITGGMGGIGKAIAEYLHDLGATIAIAYNKNGDHSTALNWQQQQKDQGYDYEIFYSDISSFDSTNNMVEKVYDKFQHIDILVNNAGVTQDTTLKKMSQQQWSTVIDTNLTGVFNVTRNVVNHMLNNNFGRIINISSINGQKGQFGQVNYCAAKAGLHGFSKALAQEVAKKNITVNTISPGYVKTSMTDKVPEKILNEIVSQIPVGRLANPKEIARMVAFLADDQSGYITGANFAINGGQHMY